MPWGFHFPSALPRGSLRLRLFLLLLASSVGPLVVTNTWGYLRTREDLTDAAYKNAGNVSTLQAMQTSEFVYSRKELITSMAAANRYLWDLVRAMGTHPDAELRADYLLRLHEYLVGKATDVQGTAELLVLDRSGRALATSDESGAPIPEETEKMCQWALGENTIVAGPDRTPGTGQLTQPTIVHAVVARVDDTPIGTLCGRFRFDVHRELRLAQQERTTDADLYLLDSAGRRLSGSFDDTEATYGELVHSSARAVVERGESWVGRYQTPNSGGAVAAYTPMPQLGWGILVEIPDRVALASLERLKWQAVFLGGLFVAAMIPVMFLISQAVARPLGVLADASRQVADGKYAHHVAEVGAAEMVTLARAFNRMGEALKDAHAGLERRIAERTVELGRSQAFSELLLDSIEQRVLVIDRRMTVIKANRAARSLHGQDLVGRTCHEQLGARVGPCMNCPVVRAFATGHMTRAEVTERTARGTDIFQLDTFPILGADGVVDAVVQIGRVVTGEKAVLAQALHQEKMAALGLLAAALAHEIGNPIASLQLQLQLVRESPGSHSASETLPLIERNVVRIATLLREFTDFARRKRDEVAWVSVSQVMEDIARLVAHDPRARLVSIVTDAPPDLPLVRVREDRLVQVLLNLALNSVDAMPNGGSLRFEARAEEGAILMRVRDTGIGIPPELRARIFEPFISGKDAERGTGLGLFVSRGIVEALGGRLTLEDTGPHGTVFAFHLPLDAQP